MIVDRLRAPLRRRTWQARDGFTLVEMLAVITVIGILSSILLGALSAAAVKAREARTKSLISKMHNMIMARWDVYRTLRLPIMQETSSGSLTGATGDEFNSTKEQYRFRQNVARRRLFGLREMMRMEMPDRYDDLDKDVNIPQVLVTQGENGRTAIRPYLWNAYRRKVDEGKFRFEQRMRTSISVQNYWSRIRIDYQSAECLYLILTTGIDDPSVATEHFTAGDTGDKDEDGMLEFHDAWGMPIGFIRWAPGFESPAQPLYRYPPGDARYSLFHGKQPTDVDDPNVRTSRWQIKVDTITGTNGKASPRIVIIDQDEPLNPLRVGPPLKGGQVDMTGKEFTRWLPGQEPPEYGFLLMPLIYSYGRDLRSGIEHCLSYEAVEHPRYDPLSPSDPYQKFKGPAKKTAISNAVGPEWYRGESTYEGHEFDNIHNHEMVLR